LAKNDFEYMNLYLDNSNKTINKFKSFNYRILGINTQKNNKVIEKIVLGKDKIFIVSLKNNELKDKIIRCNI
jgi:hypothetical protein